MPTLADARRLALALADVTEGERFGQRTWFVEGRSFAWERPLSKADIRRLGDEPVPAGELLAVRVADRNEKEALLADPPAGFFTIAHFADFPAVLIELATARPADLTEAMSSAWQAVRDEPNRSPRSGRPPAPRRPRPPRAG